MKDWFDPLDGLTTRQLLGLQDLLGSLGMSGTWSWDLPVLIRQRCWLRLESIRLNQLHLCLPPDPRGEAPELVHYRRLRVNGITSRVKLTSPLTMERKPKKVNNKKMEKL